MKLRDLINEIEAKYPLLLQYEWDNSGLNVGDENGDINSILLTLEVTEEVIDEAISKNIDLIISHHPFLFSKLNKLNNSDLKGRMIYKLIRNNISVYCMHTNLDIAYDGLNDYFLRLLNIEKSSILCYEGTHNDYLDNIPYGLGRISIFDKHTTVGEVFSILKNVLPTNDIRIIGNPDDIVTKFSVVTGSGAEFFSESYKNGCNLLITGDVKYHQAVDSIALGVNIIDCGHYGSEIIFNDLMYDFLTSKLDDMKIYKSETYKNPFITTLL